MGAAIDLQKRREILAAYAAGASMIAVAARFDVAYQTVRTLCQRVAADGEAALTPRYDRCSKTGLRSEPLYYRAACWLKRLHPGWGAPLIRLKLVERYATDDMTVSIPAVRTMQVWFRSKGLSRRRSRPPQPPKQWASHVHDVWQVDAKERQRIADGTACCWLTVTDEHSTAILAAPVFPLGPYLAGAPAAGATGTHRDLHTVGAAQVDQSR